MISILAVVTLILLFFGKIVDLLVVTSGIASCMGGIGPAFGIIAFDWSQISSLGKLIGFFAMYLGRLELMPIFLLFLPELWKK